MEIDVNNEVERLFQHLGDDERFNSGKVEFRESLALADIDYSKFYRSYNEYEDKILQTDAIKDLPVINLPDTEIVYSSGLVFSNSCDIDQANTRIYTPSLMYSPIFKLSEYENALREDFDAENNDAMAERVRSHVSDIRAQKVNQIFYLGPGQYQGEELIVFFDKVLSTENDSVSRGNLSESRTFRLSSYGWYIFLFRLSVFFNRTTEETVRMRFSAT